MKRNIKLDSNEPDKKFTSSYVNDESKVLCYYVFCSYRFFHAKHPLPANL